MSTSSNLTAKYRPQRFDEVVGQDGVKAVLSRAAGEDRIAPAYLFSGTRGVGKTTLARILAKAVNCASAPAAEPCNECAHCRAVSQGSAVDVVEIDAASNRGIEEARRLKEDIGYAPIEGRYKVFIIDEAHMLTREAFNALLKTLEEPPPHACFVLATTEPHKFPATVVSRCQHYTFRRLPQKLIEDHLRAILEGEGRSFEEEAVAIIARRGAGSVRDAMSLLAQVLALGSENLTAGDARAILGLAGQEVFFRIIEAVHAEDCAGLSRILREVLDQGLDLGFFLRELTGAWRNMFLINQSGEAAADLLDMAGEDASRWMEWAGKFDLARIHACWQLTLEGQRRVLDSLEPALALELLLFNLASLPRLLPLGKAAASGGGTSPARGPGSGPSGGAEKPPRTASPGPGPSEDGPPPGPDPGAGHASAAPARPAGPRTWEGFKAFAEQRCRQGGASINGLGQADGVFEDGRLKLVCKNKIHCDRVKSASSLRTLEELAAEYFGNDAAVEISAPEAPAKKSFKELRREVEADPAVREVMGEFGAHIVDIRRK